MVAKHCQKKLKFRKSSFSAKYGCVGVAFDGNTVYIKNTKAEAPIVTFALAEWEVFIKGVKAGEFDDLRGKL